MIGVSKTFGESSILSSPVLANASELIRGFGCFSFIPAFSAQKIAVIPYEFWHYRNLIL